MEYIGWTIAAIVAVCWIIQKSKNTGKAAEASQSSETAKACESEYVNSYQRKYLLTKNEWHEFKKLQEYANELGLLVFTKVRLLDIIEPRKGNSNYKVLLNKVQSKHIDFLICDKNVHILAVLELDDNSHNEADRQERDKFVDTVLQSVGYKVIRTRSVTADTLAPLKASISEAGHSETSHRTPV